MIRTPHPYNLVLQRKMRAKHLLIQRYQYKYALFMMKFGLVFGLVLAGVSLYFLNSNYFMFKSTLLLYAPKVIKALNLELKLANQLILTTLVIYTIFLGWLGLKLSQKIVTPIMLIQEKMRAISRGHLTDAKLQLRKTDEFQEFCDTYNYLVEILKAQTLKDIESIKKLKPDPKNKDALYVWEKVIEEKYIQLGIDPNEISSQPDLAASERRVS